MLRFLCVAPFALSSFQAVAADVFIPPATANVSSGCNYGNKPCASQNSYHDGIDFSGIDPTKREVRATNHGRVHKIIKNGDGDHGMGNTVILEHFTTEGQRVCSSYSHLKSIDDEVYEKYKKRNTPQEWLIVGTRIGEMGGTGYGQDQYWGTHLHFEMKSDCTLGAPTNPDSYWGYTPNHPSGYGYLDPNAYVGSKYANNPYNPDGSTTLIYQALMSEGYPYGIGGGGSPFNLKLDFDIMDPATGVEWIAGQHVLKPGQVVNLKVQVKAENDNTMAHMRSGRDRIEVDYYVWTGSGGWTFLSRQYIQATNLPSGGTHTETVQYTVPSGVSTLSFKVKIDAEDEAYEANEGDNWSRVETFQVDLSWLILIINLILED